MKQTLLAALNNVNLVATTTDCWTARRKSYVGLTTHWIDAEYRRQSAHWFAVGRKGHTHSMC